MFPILPYIESFCSFLVSETWKTWCCYFKSLWQEFPSLIYLPVFMGACSFNHRPKAGDWGNQMVLWPRLLSAITCWPLKSSHCENRIIILSRWNFSWPLTLFSLWAFSEAFTWTLVSFLLRKVFIWTVTLTHCWTVKRGAKCFKGLGHFIHHMKKTKTKKTNKNFHWLGS